MSWILCPRVWHHDICFLCIVPHSLVLPLRLQSPPVSKEGEVLKALSQIIDPDFGMSIVDCGFIKDLDVDGEAGTVSFRMELTTPACPVKDEFEQQVSCSERTRQHEARLVCTSVC